MPFLSFGFPWLLGLGLLAFRLTGAGKRRWVLLGLSLIFYLRAGLPSLGAMLGVSLTAWLCQQKKALGLALLTAVLVLARLGVKWELFSMPVGLSYYLLRAMADLARGNRKSLSQTVLELGFFPQMVQGPVPGAEEAGLSPTGEDVSLGLLRLSWGFFKKLVIADRLALPVAALREAGPEGLWMLSGVYALQIYMDFTGGCDMALGMARCFGVRLPENFRFPFLAGSLSQYWQRWHITLGAWMKEFIFYPVSLAAPVRRLSRKLRKKHPGLARRVNLYPAMVLTWLATGLWHGFYWNFALWGLLNCGFLLLSQEAEPLLRRFRRPWMEGRLFGAFRVARTFLLVNLIRVCDLYPQVSVYFRGLFTPRWLGFEALGLERADVWVLGAGMLTVLAVQLRFDSWQALLGKRKGLTAGLLCLLGLLTLIFGQYGLGYDAASFVYGAF